MPHVIGIRHRAPNRAHSLRPDFSDVSPSGETLSFNNQSSKAGFRALCVEILKVTVIPTKENLK